jgi:hypothetical protein
MASPIAKDLRLSALAQSSLPRREPGLRSKKRLLMALNLAKRLVAHRDDI